MIDARFAHHVPSLLKSGTFKQPSQVTGFHTLIMQVYLLFTFFCMQPNSNAIIDNLHSYHKKCVQESVIPPLTPALPFNKIMAGLFETSDIK